MANNFMGPSQMMGQQLSGALQAASESAANQRAAIAAQQMEQQKMAREMEVNFDMYKLMSGVDNVSAFQFLNKGLSYIGRSVETGNEERVYRIFEEANKRKQAGDLQGMGDLLKKADLFMVKTADRDRAFQMRTEAGRQLATQQAETVMNLQGSDPAYDRATTILQYQDVLRQGMPSPADAEKLTALTGSNDPLEWRKQMVLAETVKQGRELRQQSLASLYQQSPDAFQQTAKELGKSQGDWQAVGMGRLSDLLLTPNRTPEQEQELLAKAAVHAPQLYNMLTAQSAQTQVERRQAELGQVRDRKAELSGYLDAFLGAKSQVAGLATATDGLPSPDQPLPDAQAAPHVLTMGTLEAQTQNFARRTEDSVTKLESAITASQESLRHLKIQAAVRPGQREMIESQIREHEQAIASNQALVRLLRDENPYVLAQQKAAFEAEPDAVKRREAEMRLTDLDQRRQRDEAIIAQEQARLDRQESILQGKMTADERKAQKEKDMTDAVAATVAAINSGVKQPAAVRDAAGRFHVDWKALSEQVTAYRGNFVAEAQNKFAMLPTEQQTTQNAGKIGQDYGLSAQVVMEGIKNPNKPLVQLDMQGEASKEAQRDFIKSTRATYDQLKSAPMVLRNIEDAKALIPQAKGFMGPAGESLLNAAKFLNARLGAQINVEGIKSAEELRTRLFFGIMENLKKMDAQPSEMQQIMMREALGNLGNDPNALINVLDAFGDTIRDKVELFNREISGAKDVKFPYDPRIQLPLKKSSSGDYIVRSEEDRKAVPPGSIYIAPDGKRRRKQ